MALSEEALQELMEDDNLDNAPAKLKGAGLTGHRPVVPVAEQRARREMLAQMKASGMSKDAIVKVMSAPTLPDGSPGFNMTEKAVQLLTHEVFEAWAEEDAENRPRLKAMAVRRIKRQIVKASAKHNYAAIAQLERTLMMIEGTAEPIKVEVTGVERVSVAVQNVLNVQTPEEMSALVAEEKAFVEKHGTAPLLLEPGEVIDAECE